MNLKQELKAEKVIHLDLSGYCQVESGTPIRDVLAQMRAEKHNVSLVVADGKLVGIFTDRDVLRKVAAQPETWDLPVDEVMTRNPVTVTADTSAAAALKLIEEKNFRNVPVVDEDGRILGDMTFRAIIKYLADRYPIQILNRPPNPERFPRKPEGG
ncbi:MAG: CBS domain-containing protein [Chloroflexi bacterium]|nr:MAG: CBS domain-containing protein [Chloroflexota bacterium]